MNGLVELCVRDTTAMKPKLILCLALAVFTFAARQSAYGYEVPFEINRTNINTDFSFLLIKAVHYNYNKTNDETVMFTIIVMPRDNHQPENFYGLLTVMDGKKHIVTTSLWRTPKGQVRQYPDIPKPLRAKAVMFEFYISAKYLSDSEFKLEEGPDNGPSYFFKLKEFDDEKSTKP